MRRAVLLITFLAALPGVARAVPEPAQARADFQAANERALSGDIEGAIGLYRSLEEQGIEHPDLFFNLGNALARTGHLTEAVVAYERALRLAPQDADARLNLAAVRAKLAPKSSEEPAEARSMVDLIEPIVAPLPRDAFAWASVVLCLLFFTLLAIRETSPRRRRGATLALIPALLALIAVSIPVAGQELVRRDARAVVMKSTQLKKGPDPRFPVVTPISAGERVRVRNEDGGWLEVQDELGRVGWLSEDEVTRL